MKFKTYKKVDLIVLCVLAFIIEICATYAASAFIPMMAPYPIMGMLLTLVAITRWGPIGLIVGPFSTLGNFICGAFWLPQEIVRTAYYFTWVIGLFGNMSVATAFIFFKRKGKELCFKTMGEAKSLLFTIIITNFLISFTILFIYNLFKGTVGLSNLAACFGETAYGCLIYNAVGYVVLVLGTIALKSQNILVDVKATILRKQEEQELEAKYYSNIKKTSDDKSEDD